MNNMNLNNDMLNNLKNMLGEDKVNDALSQISPDMIDNFSKMMSNNSSNSNSSETSDNSNDFDVETLMKMKSVIEKMNHNGNDPRSNLLNSLKPYLSESRKENIDKYANMLKMANLASLFNNDFNNNKKENYPDE